MNIKTIDDTKGYLLRNVGISPNKRLLTVRITSPHPPQDTHELTFGCPTDCCAYAQFTYEKKFTKEHINQPIIDAYSKDHGANVIDVCIQDPVHGPCSIYNTHSTIHIITPKDGIVINNTTSSHSPYCAQMKLLSSTSFLK